MIAQKLYNKHEGETGIILCNGKTLLEAPQELLDKYVTFGSNKIYLLNEVDGYDPEWKPTYWAGIDTWMTPECLPHVIGWGPPLFVPRGFPVPDSIQLHLRVEADFSDNIARDVVIGGSVTYVQMQIAAYMGIKKILIVGMDQKYTHTPGDGQLFLQQGPDEDHFHPNYFEHNHLYARWMGEQKAAVTYVRAREYLEERGIEVFNLTSGKTAFERSSVKDWT